MMDKSREPENNTTHSTPRFKDRGNQKQQHKQKKKENFIRSNRQLLPAKFSLSIQPNAGLCRVEFNRKPWNKFKIQVIPPKACSDFFFLSLQPPPPESSDKSWVFALSWGNDWARGQTSRTDENKRLSGGLLKENCWGGRETFMSCCCGSNGSECVFLRVQCGGGWEVLIYIL